MKKIIAVFLVLSAFSCAQSQKTNFTETALNEKLIARDNGVMAFKDILDKYESKTIVIEIWASWCSDCVKAIPKVKELQTKHPEAAYVFISMDKSAESWKNGIEKHQLIGDHFLAQDQMQGVFAKAVDLDWIPRYMIIDKNGKIVLYRAIETDFQKMDEVLNKMK